MNKIEQTLKNSLQAMLSMESKIARGFHGSISDEEANAMLGVKSALSEIEKCEPVAEVAPSKYGSGTIGVNWLPSRKKLMYGDKLYTSSQQRKWVGLSDDEIGKLWLNVSNESISTVAFGKRLQEKLRELNIKG